MPRPFYDNLWKGLPIDVLVALIRLVVPEIGSSLTPWQTELVPPVTFRMDDAFLGEVAATQCLVHLEYQNSLDPTMPHRMYEYDLELERATKTARQVRLPIISIVIWAVAGETPTPVYHAEFLGKTFAHHEYFEIHLTEIPWQQDLDPVLLVLAPYFQGVERSDLIAIGERLYEKAPPEERLMLLGSFMALSQRSFGSIDDVIAAIVAKVGQIMIDIEQAIAESTFGQAILARGKAEGVAQGEATGMNKGLREAIAALWQTVYQSELPADIAEALRARSEQDLLAVLSAVALRPTEVNLRARFGL